MDFEQILAEAKNQNPEAKEILFELYRPLLLKYSYLGGVFDEDLWQEQCLRFVTALKLFHLDSD